MRVQKLFDCIIEIYEALDQVLQHLLLKILGV